MDTRLTTTHWRLLLATVMALTMVMALEATSATAAKSAACSITNTDTGRPFPRLQQAADAAKPGAHLVVRGTCHGGTVIGANLAIEGIRTAETRPLLAGDHRGVVLTVRRGATVTVSDLAIEGGRGHFREGGPEKPYNWPAGVLNNGNLTLRSVIVKENRGIGIENTGRLRLKGRTLVRENESSGQAEGIHNTGTVWLNGTASVRSPDEIVNDGILVMNGASWIRYLRNSGSATLKDASRATKVLNRGTLTLGDQSRIAGLSGTSFLVGVDNFGTLILNDASGIVHGYVGVQNWPGSKTVMNGSSVIRDHEGGAVRNSGTLVLNGSSSIRDNHYLVPACGSVCSHDPLRGAGVLNTGAVVLNDSSAITNNAVEDFRFGSFGGGVYMMRDSSLPEPPSLTMTGSATISGNSASDSGGGIYVGTGSTHSGVSCGPQTLANVHSNSPDDCYFNIESP